MKAEYETLTSLPGDAPLKEESVDPAKCSNENVGVDPGHNRESKTDGSVTLSMHEDGTPAKGLMCGNGMTGEDTIENSKITNVALSKSNEKTLAEACGERHTLKKLPADSNKKCEVEG